MYKLISDEIPILFHEHIMNYINTKLITDMYNSGVLYESNIYYEIIKNKLDEISFNITKKYMELVDSIGGPVNINNNAPMSLIRLNILLTFTTVGNHYMGSTKDHEYKLSSYSNFYDNEFNYFYYQKMFHYQYNETNIKNAIYKILLQQINYSDTTVDIKSMEIIKTSYSDNNFNNEIKTLMIKYI
jgi:hypothetical protein